MAKSDYPSSLAPCSCDAEHNLPVLIPDGFGKAYVICDFCNKRTRMCPSEEVAEFRWNEFVAKGRGEGKGNG